MPVYYDKARKRWRYEFDRLVGGRRQRATKLLPATWSRQEAEGYAREQDSKLYAVATGATKPRRLISEAVGLYLTQHATMLKSGDIIRRELANCVDAYMGRHIDELAEVARAYAAEQAGTLQPATIKNRMAYLRAACRWAWKHHGIGEHDPAERMTLPRVRNERHVYVGRADMLRIARAITNREARAVALVAFYSGMRLGEILRAVPVERGWLLEDTKNGERRLVPIHPKVAYLARRWPPTCSPRTAHKRLTAAAQAMGFPDLRFHDLRHSAASEMVNAGVDLYSVGAVLGHKAAASTKRYAHLANDTLAKALGKIGSKQ
jgi:integrase